MIRKAKTEDLPVLDQIYESARNFMHSHGNPNQWNDGHPCSNDLSADIQDGILYVIEEDGEIQASFVYYEGTDPTYGYIDHGAWPSERNRYGIGHKVASRSLKPGMGHQILAWIKAQHPEIRMDTHADNHPMRMLFEREGFIHCGTIYLENGDPRMAFIWRQDEPDNCGRN